MLDNKKFSLGCRSAHSPFYLLVKDIFFFFFQAEDGIRDADVTGVQTCALPIFDFFLFVRRRLDRLKQDLPFAEGDRLSLDAYNADRKSTRLNSSHVRISYA